MDMIRIVLRLLGPTRLLAIILAVMVLVSLAAREGNGQELLSDPAITQIRIQDQQTHTRVILDMAATADFRLGLLNEPDRMVLDVPRVRWHAEGAVGEGAGLVVAHRYGALDDRTMRVVFDLAGPARVRDAFYLPATSQLPYRLVIDLVPPDEAATEDTTAQDDPIGNLIAANLGPSEDELASLAATSAATDLPVVVIDPGHGGVDPGAVGVTGIFEKTIALTVSRMLSDLLTETGRYHVVMTRDSDVYIRLEDRVAIARAAGADLFLSVHADSIEETWIRGASVYTLSDEASDSQAALLALRENRADAVAGVDWDRGDDVVTDIVIGLAQRLSIGHASVFADMMIDRLGERSRLLNNTHREAGFVVLKAPDVPSALVELGYLSNREDERLLSQESHQRALAEALFQSVEDYFAWRTVQGGI